MAKSTEVVRERLLARGKDSIEQINIRVKRMEWDINFVKESGMIPED